MHRITLNHYFFHAIGYIILSRHKPLTLSRFLNIFGVIIQIYVKKQQHLSVLLFLYFSNITKIKIYFAITSLIFSSCSCVCSASEKTDEYENNTYPSTAPLFVHDFICRAIISVPFFHSVVSGSLSVPSL